MVTKMSYRYLHHPQEPGTVPELNLTKVLSTRLLENFKRFCKTPLRVLLHPVRRTMTWMRVATHGDDYAIACCVSSMRLGKEMQFFGARANLAKCLLYAITAAWTRFPANR